jgi:hypothetical protein
VKNSQYGVGVEYFVPNSDFYLSGNLGRDELEVDNLPIDQKVTTYSAEVGYLPAPGLLIAAGLKGYDNDYDDGVDPTLRAKYVTSLSNGKDINLEAGAGFGDLDEYNLAADYFIDKTLSLGVDYYSKDRDYGDTNEFGINARKFFTPQVSLEGRVGFGEVGNNSRSGLRHHHRSGRDRRLYRYRPDGWQVPRSLGSPAGADERAADQDVPAGRSDRRGLPDRRRYRDAVRLREPVRPEVIGLSRRSLFP